MASASEWRWAAPIVRRPRLFLFDEPLSNLDASLRAQVRVEIRRLHDRLGATSIYVTHDQVEAMTLADHLFVLNQGLVEQQGRPLSVYARPKTRFVASFLGSPTMNFLEAELCTEDDSPRVEAPGVSLTVPAERLPGRQPAARQPVIVGIRPHDVQIGADTEEQSLSLSVDVLEALGSESFVHGHIREQPFVARLDGNQRPAQGETLTLRAAAEHIHLFDPETGRSLAGPT